MPMKNPTMIWSLKDFFGDFWKPRITCGKHKKQDLLYNSILSPPPKKNRSLQSIWHNFTNLQHLLIIVGRERPYSILNSYDKKVFFLNWLRTSRVVSIRTVATWHTRTANFWADFKKTSCREHKITTHTQLKFLLPRFNDSVQWMRLGGVHWLHAQCLVIAVPRWLPTCFTTVHHLQQNQWQIIYTLTHVHTLSRTL